MFTQLSVDKILVWKFSFLGIFFGKKWDSGEVY